MADSETKEINWYQPKKRTVFILKDLKLPRSLNQLKKKNIFKLTYDLDFEKIMRHCSERNETWISEDIISSYVNLFEMGLAHSVETRKNAGIVGGLYGVSIGSIFFGESMFSKVSGASKIAFAFLVEKLKLNNYDFIDAQFMTEHLKMLGAVEISNNEYQKILKESINKECKFE